MPVLIDAESPIMRSEIPNYEQQIAIKLLRAAAHEAVAATERLHAEMIRVIPRGTKVKVVGSWKGVVSSYVMPLEGEVVVMPDDTTQTSGWRTFGKNGEVTVHVDRIELIGD